MFSKQFRQNLADNYDNKVRAENHAAQPLIDQLLKIGRKIENKQLKKEIKATIIAFKKRNL